MKNNIVDIIIPTFNNTQYLVGCLSSLIHYVTPNLIHIYVINNGHKDSCSWISDPQITVINAEDNLGWEGGLKLGLEHSNAPFVLFMNDDTRVPPSELFWLNKLLQHFNDPTVGAVGPSSNVVMGMQNIFVNTPNQTLPATYLIGFCMLVRKEALEKAGGIDDSLPGGDDLDLSIRLRDSGYRLVIDRNVFIYHHGFKTGERVYGTPDQTGGWNSFEFKESTDHALIRKHGFRKYYECIMGTYMVPKEATKSIPDIEGELIREKVEGKIILDVGCGGNKTLPNAIGIDFIPNDNPIPTLNQKTISQADVVADVSKELPFEDNYADTIIARHILEHMIDPIEVIKNWTRVLKPNGKLIIAVPDNSKFATIPVNIEHVHAYTRETLKHLLEALNLKVIEQFDGKNNVSFITIAQKI